MKVIESVKQLFRPSPESERGLAVVEYAMMMLLIVIAITAFGQGISGAVTGVFSAMLSVLA